MERLVWRGYYWQCVVALTDSSIRQMLSVLLGLRCYDDNTGPLLHHCSHGKVSMLENIPISRLIKR